MGKSGRFTPLILALFVGSGCSALVYEVVWFQLLSLVIGASAISLALLLASFMGGMCIGSLTFPRFVSRSGHPLRMYAYLELGIAVFGILILVVLPQLRTVYWSVAGYGYAGILLRGVVAAACLLPPTILMGATLPAISRWVETTRIGLSRLGLFYGANIVGAVVGTLLAGFYLLRVHNIYVATFFAAALNVAVALVALWVAKGAAYAPPSEPAKPAPELEPVTQKRNSTSIIYVVTAISGFTALGAEVVWTRLLSLLFGPTVYTFSIILAVFLGGLAMGSGAGSLVSRWLKRPAIGLAWAQFFLILSIPFAAYMIAEIVPFWFSERIASQSIWERMILDLVRGACAIAPPAFFWGASFPLALAAVRERSDDPGRLVGGVYAANTLGAIGGSLLFGMAGVPMLGSHGSQQLLTIVVAISALLLFGRAAISSKLDRDGGAPGGWSIWRKQSVVVSVTIIFIAPVMAGGLAPVPEGLIAYGRNVDSWNISQEFLYIGEGIDATIAVTQPGPGQSYLHVSGKVVASNDPIDMRIQRMLGHLPALVHPEPKTALVIGCGAGVTAGSLLMHPSIERIVICDIEARVPEASAKYFATENHGVLTDPRTEVIRDDARHFISSTNEKFDIITTDPIHPWVRGAASLYTSEFFELCKERINPGGVVVQWVPLYETSTAAVKSELATFAGAFPHTTLWNSNLEGGGYDLVVLGTLAPTQIDVAALGERLDNEFGVQRSLAQVDLLSIPILLGTFVGTGAGLQQWLMDAQLNRDRNLRLQYLAGLSLDSYLETEIYHSMKAYREYPEHIFINADPVTERSIKRLLNR